MNDFVCRVNFVTHKYNLCKNTDIDYSPSTYSFNSPSYFSVDYLNFVANISKIREPVTYFEPKTSPAWVEAMEEEIRALERNYTWDIYL